VGFAQFNDGKSVGKAMLGTCISCHVPVEARDYVFTRHAP
jgi:hypothetical protein